MTLNDKTPRSGDERGEDQCYVRNSSFLSRDIEAQKAKAEASVKKTSSPPVNRVVPPKRDVSLPQKKEKVNLSTGSASPPKNEASPKKQQVTSPPPKEIVTSPPKKQVTSPPKITSPPPVNNIVSPPPKKDVPTFKKEITSPPPTKDVTSPPVSAFKLNRVDSKTDENQFLFKNKKDTVLGKEVPIKSEKLSLVSDNGTGKKSDTENGGSQKVDKVDSHSDNVVNSEESVGVGDKIKKFEKAAEDASASASGRLSRPGSVRGRSRTERLGSDSKEDLPLPATPFKDNVHFELGNVSGKSASIEAHQANFVGPLERQQSLTRSSANLASLRWQRSDSNSGEEKAIQKPEPQKIIKPEFKPISSPAEVTIRSPSLGTKIGDQFPSHGTAFRNVASPDPARTNAHKFNDDVNTQNNFKTCKFKNKEKYSVSKGSSYFTRGSEEIWLVKKKDIEEIEERVLDSFRRAGGNLCMRSESMRPSSDSGQGASFTHATMGRNKRQMYARSESLDPQWSGARAQTLKRQSSVACTCGHDKKTRAKSAGAEATLRPRSRSHGDENNQGHVLDKYETLV